MVVLRRQPPRGVVVWVGEGRRFVFKGCQDWKSFYLLHLARCRSDWLSAYNRALGLIIGLTGLSPGLTSKELVDGVYKQPLSYDDRSQPKDVGKDVDIWCRKEMDVNQGDFIVCSCLYISLDLKISSFFQTWNGTQKIKIWKLNNLDRVKDLCFYLAL